MLNDRIGKYLNPKNYVRFFILRFVHFLSPLEQQLLESYKELKYPPIFIVGPPRSGTTLLYQVIVHCFYVAYFPNIAARFYEIPVIATKIGKIFFRPYKSDFTSTYGLVRGTMAPHEAGSIWNRWFPTEQKHGYNYTPAGYLSERTKKIIYQTVAGIEAIFDAPFVNKNVYNSVRIQALNEIFPNVIFLQIKRNPLDVAISILYGRKKRSNKVSDWWSVMPKEIEELKDKDVFEQIVGQIFFVEKNIEEDIRVIGKERLLVIHYEELCESPQKVLRKIKLFADKHGAELRPKYPIPDSFKRSRSIASEDEIKKFKALLERYYGKDFYHYE